MADMKQYTIGWIGAGRMGYSMAKRLLDAGCDVSIYNRTRSKAEPLIEYGGKVVDTPQDLGDRDIVFTMVSASNDLISVVFGENGLLTGEHTPKLLIECSSVSEEASAQVRSRAADMGVDMLASPVSGNAKVGKAGKLTIVTSGPRPAFDMAEPYLEAIGRGVTYVGEDELAAQSVGINLTAVKVTAMTAGGFIAGIGGALYAHTATYVDHLTFTVLLATFAIAYPILGGLSSVFGTLVAVVFIQGVLVEGLRFLGDWRNIVFGLLIIAAMNLKPSGLFDARTARILKRAVGLEGRGRPGA